ncbi:MAG TPA: peptidase U32 family protein [Exilispira sp.]|nr:peptidase U32 family protein [Exilispira sp.]
MNFQKDNIPELIAPAGSLESAIYAFNAGADAVYFGLSNFSARKYAINFDEKHYRKLLKYAKNNNKKVYLTLNTIIKEDEIGELTKLLKFLSFFPPDAIIIQDFGIIGLIRYYLEGINIHASTQSGTYSKYSYDLIKKLGIKRVILARESTFNDIINIKNNFNDIEMEVFIHGALCYSFSGFCLASGILLQRSGNRGECAQICRNYFQINSKSFYDNYKVSLFSCNDLNLGENIIQLAKIGVNSFKIEGRMKDPEYTFNTVKFYKDFLEKYQEKADILKKDNNIDKQSSNEKNIKLSFSRIPTNGYFHVKNGEKLINPFFPYHIGINLGIIKDIKKDNILVKLEEDIRQRDGVLILLKTDCRIISFPFSVSKLTVDGKEIFKANKGQIVKIYSSKLFDFISLLSKNITYDFNLDDFDLSKIINNDFIILRKISDRNLDLPKINENLLDEEKIRLILNIKVKYSEVKFIDKVLNDFDNLYTKDDKLYQINLNYSYQIISNLNNFSPLEYEKNYENNLDFVAQQRIGNKSYLEIFEQEMTKSIKEDIFDIKINIDNDSKQILNNIFIQPSINKKIIKKIKDEIRDNLYNYLNSIDNLQNLNNKKFILKPFTITNKIEEDIELQKKMILDKLSKNQIIKDSIFYRKKISPQNKIERFDDNKIIPFVTFNNLKQIDLNKNDEIFKLENIVFLPLNPIIYNEDQYLKSIERMINENKEFIFIFGINSSWHFYLYKKYIENLNIFFFFDFYIYISNRFSLQYYANFEKSLFGNYWIEFQDEIKQTLTKNLNESYDKKENFKNFNLFEIKDFDIPLFISRGCINKNVINNFSCPENCPKNYLFKLKNQKNDYIYIIENCISYLFKIN